MKKQYKLFLRLALVIIAMFYVAPHTVQSQIINPGSYEKLRQDTLINIRHKINPLLSKYCNGLCEFIKADLEINEALPENQDLGFEGVMEDEVHNLFYVEKAFIKIQVDARVNATNRERISRILSNQLSSLGFQTEIVWAKVDLPNINESDDNLNTVKKRLSRRLSHSIDDVIQRYCPESCLLGRVSIDGYRVSPDEASSINPLSLVKSKTGAFYLKVEDVVINLEMDDSISEKERTRILNMMKVKTKYVQPVKIAESLSSFPQTYESKKSLKNIESKDPYGLEKLRRTLKMFKELAGTKEIITRSSTNNSSEIKRLSDSKTSSLSKASEVTNSLEANKDKTWIDGVPNWIFIVSGLLLLLMGAGVLFSKITSAQRDAQYMMQAAPQLREQATEGEYNVNTEDKGNVTHEIALRLKNEELRKELVDVFMKNPRVAKETFSRMLEEDGVEEASKYVHIFGHLVVFELLGDPNLSRQLYELSEYYHKSEYDFDLDEEWKLLMSLRTKVTANEIRVLTRRTSGRFDFLLKLDPSQIFHLITDESPSVQSIVLTQLDAKHRRAVYDLYQGEAKVALLKELSVADAIPKDYLYNVARALHKKVQSKPEFDVENLRSADILLDLIEKSTLDEQKALMINLEKTNKESARAIKLKLVTLEMLPYLKDGHLLELILGLDREDLLNFLASTDDRTKDLFLSHAPEELAESWMEDLEHHGYVDESEYRLLTMKILSKVRTLAANGVIDLLAINEMIFAPEPEEEDEFIPEAGQVVA